MADLTIKRDLEEQNAIQNLFKSINECNKNALINKFPDNFGVRNPC